MELRSSMRQVLHQDLAGKSSTVSLGGTQTLALPHLKPGCPLNSLDLSLDLAMDGLGVRLEVLGSKWSSRPCLLDIRTNTPTELNLARRLSPGNICPADGGSAVTSTDNDTVVGDRSLPRGTSCHRSACSQGG